ncbi:MAG: DNA-processing protein DprA [Acidimicrobiales bacterium]
MLRLLDAPTMGPRRVQAAVAKFGTARGALEELQRSGSASMRTYLTTTHPDDDHVAAIERTLALGGDFVLWCDPQYPTNLRTWDGRPPILFYMGELQSLPSRSLALVGRVDPTEDGVSAATRLAGRCVEHGIAVISGLAKGIDAASHHGALATPTGRTFAVLGHGLDYRYPRENAELYDAIPERGALISQFRTGMRAQRWTFPARNEVMCTLALATVIVEGKTGCGSLIQADFSFKHGRPVLVLSRNLRDPDSEWARRLVHRGAHVVERFDDVLRLIDGHAEAMQMSMFGNPRSETTDGPADDPRSVLFDLDGVVVDTRAATATALARIAERHTGHIVDPVSVPVVGRPHDVLRSLGVRNAYDVYRSEYDDAFLAARGEVRVFPAVVECIRDLKARRIRLGAVTAQPKRRADIMLPPEVRELFDVVLCYNDTGGKKDVGIDLALSKLGVSVRRAVFVGDQPADLAAARAAGVRSIGVLWGFSTEDELRRWPSDLLLGDQAEFTYDAIEALLG